MFLNVTNITTSATIPLKFDPASTKAAFHANGTPSWTDHPILVNGEELERKKDILIVAAVVILVFVIVICSLLCYRELSRKRLEARLLEEYLRKEEIRKTNRRKIAQMQSMDDSDSYLNEEKMRTPLVRFGDVTLINPVSSTETLHQYHHHHHHFFHHHHHHHFHDGNDKDARRPSPPFLGQEKYWNLSQHRIPTRGRFLSTLCGRNKKNKCQATEESKASQLTPMSSQAIEPEHG